MPFLLLPPLSPLPPLQEYTGTASLGFPDLLLFASITEASSVFCHETKEAKPDKMFIPKRYKFIHLVIACPCETQTAAHSHPHLGRPLSFSSQTSKPTPSCIAAFHRPPIPHSLPSPSSGSLWFQKELVQPDREEKKEKRKTGLGRARCASLKEMLFSPSFLLWGVAASRGWSLGGFPTKGSLRALGFSGLTTHKPAGSLG